MVLAYHCIFTAYGFWLPNDPRGSWSNFVGAWELLKFGGSTKTETRQSVAGNEHDRRQRQSAKNVLKFSPVQFSGHQALAIARGFAKASQESGYGILACSIMPDHVHIVSARHERPVEKLIGHLKARATQRLIADGLHPFVHLNNDQGRTPSVWAERVWKVYLDSESDIVRATDYTNGNPEKQGLNRQNWRFVVPRIV